ncbi:MAG: hypothetical protein KF770_14355 [Anaerolineae bacterium]|nr:hypothetical protein [Anaerolineae bacterium]
MATVSKNNTRAVPTTILTIDRGAIDWKRLGQNSHIVRYDVRRKEWGESASKYYGSMHNWYKQESEYPCYLHTFGPHLYVKYDNADEVAELKHEGRPLPWKAVNVQDKELLPQILKLLLADFFQVDGRFVSNADFFLWATADKDFVTGLKIKLTHNWQEDEFIISDQATRLRKLRPSDFDKINDWKRKNVVYYGRFYREGMAIFKQLKPDQLTKEQLKEGIYELFEGSLANRASLTFHSTKSLRALQQTRSYLLNHFIAQFIAYLNGLGLPFEQKRLSMQPMHTMSTSAMKERQLPLEQKPIYIVDDRLNALRSPDDFAACFCQVANAATPDHDTLFVVKPEDEIEPGDWVLRIQDYEKDDFDSETGILKDWQDTKADFYARHPDVVKQTMNVNNNSKKRQKEAERQKSRDWSATEYLEYDVPMNADLKTQLEVCRNQLLLKDVVMYPQNVSPRLPQIQMMADMMFLYQEVLVYFDGQDLHFMAVANNFDVAVDLVRAHTGWDLENDVLIPSAYLRKYEGMPDAKEIDGATKRPFIISRDFVWEIWEGNGRVLNEDAVIRERLEALEQPRPIKQYYPPQLDNNPLFDRQQLQAYTEFLDREVRQSTISFVDLKTQYGNHIKDERGTILVENGGFFSLLGIHRAKKYREYLKGWVGLPLESVREDHLFPVYKGIWYAPDTNHYVAGVKDPNTEEQERSHTLRRIVVHQGDQSRAGAQVQIAKSFFPLLEVNFIRHKNYTVMPFPFKLIEIWQGTEQFTSVANLAD